MACWKFLKSAGVKIETCITTCFGVLFRTVNETEQDLRDKKNKTKKRKHLKLNKSSVYPWQKTNIRIESAALRRRGFKNGLMRNAMFLQNKEFL